MERTKQVFISDVHMNTDASLDTKASNFTYGWLNPADADILASLLTSLKDDETLDEIVFLGDLFDNWVCPVTNKSGVIVPPTINNIINASCNKKIKDCINAILKEEKIKVLYIPGNHDMSTTEKDITNNFPGMIWGGSNSHHSIYLNGRIWGEHGHAYTMFCAPDFKNDPINHLPLGYYLSRIVATKVANTGSSDLHYWEHLIGLLGHLGHDQMPGYILEVVTNEAGLNEDVEIRIPSGLITIGDVKKRYATLFDDWVNTVGELEAIKSVEGELGNLLPFADSIGRNNSGVKIVIFGHNHEPEVYPANTLIHGNKIYANCGTWCRNDVKGQINIPCTFVEVEKQEDGTRVVRLIGWDRQNNIFKEYDSADIKW